jgi:hypothetical protein
VTKYSSPAYAFCQLRPLAQQLALAIAVEPPDATASVSQQVSSRILRLCSRWSEVSSARCDATELLQRERSLSAAVRAA